jgi:hypothetical protein
MQDKKFEWPCEWMYDVVKQWQDGDFQKEDQEFIKRVNEILYEINTTPKTTKPLKVSFWVDPNYDIRDHWNDEDIRETRFKLTVAIYDDHFKELTKLDNEYKYAN